MAESENRQGMQPHPERASVERLLLRVADRGSPWRGSVYRAATEAWSEPNRMLDGRGSRVRGGRWTPPGLRAVYASLQMDAAIREFQATGGYFDLDGKLVPFMVRPIDVDARSVADIGRIMNDVPSIALMQEALRTDWRAGTRSRKLAIGQEIGRAAFLAGVEGIIVPSACVAGSSNLVLFPDNYQPGTTVVARQQQRRVL